MQIKLKLLSTYLLSLHAIAFIPNASQNKMCATSHRWTIVDSNASKVITVEVFN
jgi:hypothetical protein